jgi:hypothetical protein
VTRRHYSISVSGQTSTRIDARCDETGFFRSAVVEDACREELAAGERLLEERRMVRK